MTAKRFTVDDAGTLIDIQTRDMFDIVEEVVDLLNEQHETIERLKENCKLLDEVKCEIAEENEQLRTKNNAYIQDIEVFKEENTHLKLENEELRDRLKDWHQRTFEAHEYFNILEKVIDEVCDDDISNQIWKEYEKREKLIE